MTTTQHDSRNRGYNIKPQAGGMYGELPTQANEVTAQTAQKAKEAIGTIGTDVTKLVRNNPVPAVLLALSVGFLLARFTYRS